jgi:mRNA interferase MazF
MGRFVRGEVVVTPFPFSDLARTKRRPALVVAPLIGDDVILCQITSQATSDPYAIELTPADFESGKLKQTSNIRPNRLFTADSNIVIYRAGALTAAKIDEVTTKIVAILQANKTS